MLLGPDDCNFRFDEWLQLSDPRFTCNTVKYILDRRKYQCVESKGICIVLHPSEGMVTGGMDVRKEHETGSSSRRSGALARPQGQRRKPSLFVVLLSI